MSLSLRTPRTRRGLPLALALALLGLASTPSSASVLTFDDIALGPDGTANVFGLYEDPGSGFFLAGDFQARGAGATSSLTPETSEGSGMITTSLAPFGPGLVTLTHEDGLPFELVSIDLAREFQFNDPSAGVSFPEVTFTGILAGGGTVSQTFSVDQEGFFFRTFAFSGAFTGLAAVTWEQPAFGVPDPNNPGRILGLHQFDRIAVNVVPEPSSMGMVVLGALGVAAGLTRRRRPALAPARASG
ncbi:PEP-CTERM sorting domain-containing protein [Tautonia plasticadhaerens]|uniref:Ice-binding protein C-terminal domain-containing protein n=1 Tax=Tautonia plasticadhaerens TaxID=2527974 RepID=A0A518H2S9_9BACT|nr:PEP-CTERM sorting domain-containing protein [Tautonia plasticadhaerens]QDV35127.1 hypothetical protein ElP_30290 [Tautonia plasticadhaerens]